MLTLIERSQNIQPFLQRPRFNSLLLTLWGLCVKVQVFCKVCCVHGCHETESQGVYTMWSARAMRSKVTLSLPRFIARKGLCCKLQNILVVKTGMFILYMRNY